MGSLQSKEKRSKEAKEVTKKIRQLQEVINEMVAARDGASEAHQRDVMASVLREAEWRRERKKMTEEVKMLKMVLEEREERIREMEAGETSAEKEWEMVGIGSLLMEERERRDEAVDKWKRLYLAIKIELDDLIQRTCRGEGLCSKLQAEDDNSKMEHLRKELKEKEEMVEVLQGRIAAMEDEGSKKEREVDILRQSLRIMSHKRK